MVFKFKNKIEREQGMSERQQLEVKTVACIVIWMIVVVFLCVANCA